MLRMIDKAADGGHARKLCFRLFKGLTRGYSGKAASDAAASPSQMGRFETRWLTAEKNLSALADLSGKWIDSVHARRPPRGIVLDMDSSVSPTHGEQEMSVRDIFSMKDVLLNDCEGI